MGFPCWCHRSTHPRAFGEPGGRSLDKCQSLCERLLSTNQHGHQRPLDLMKEIAHISRTHMKRRCSSIVVVPHGSSMFLSSYVDMLLFLTHQICGAIFVHSAWFGGQRVNLIRTTLGFNVGFWVVVSEILLPFHLEMIDPLSLLLRSHQAGFRSIY